MFVYHCPHEETWKGDAASPLVVDPTGVYFRREGSGGQFITGWSPAEEDDPDCSSCADLECPDYEMFENVNWPTIATRVPKFEDIKLISAWAGFYEYNTFDQVRVSLDGRSAFSCNPSPLLPLVLSRRTPSWASTRTCPTCTS